MFYKKYKKTYDIFRDKTICPFVDDIKNGDISMDNANGH